MKERILVTGGTGYIGSHTVVELQNSGYEVIIIDNLSNSSADVVDNIEKVSGIRPVFEKLDCLDFAGLDAVFTKYKGIKAIIHFAASKAVGESVQKPLLYYRNNLVSLINLLELMPKHGVEGIVFSSSCTVYGQPDELPVTEKAPIKKAESPYGNTKQINEEIIRDTVASGAPINAIMLRYFNPIGAHPTALLGELPNGTNSPLAAMVVGSPMTKAITTTWWKTSTPKNSGMSRRRAPSAMLRSVNNLTKKKRTCEKALIIQIPELTE